MRRNKSDSFFDNNMEDVKENWQRKVQTKQRRRQRAQKLNISKTE